MDQIVWVYGNAAVGKETFIHHIAKKRDGALLGKLGWSDVDFHIVEESIAWVAYDKDHPFLEKRDTLPEVIRDRASKTSSTEQVFLVKGQFVDLEAKRTEATARLLPSLSHHIIYLDASPKDILERLKKKAWFKDDFDIDRVKKLLHYEVDLLKALDSEIPITVIDSGNEYSYKIKETPPNISEYFDS